MNDRVRSFDVVRLDAGTGIQGEADVAHEEPLEIQVNGASVAVVMRTPGHDEELASGFLLTERIVRSIDEIASVRHCTTVPDEESDGNVLQVRLIEGVRLDLERLRRHSYASSSCGVCGKATIAHACATAGALDDDARMAADALSCTPDRLREQQPTFDATGGVHAAGLFRLDGSLVAAREDVGRHNAVDKVIGVLAAAGLEPSHHALVVSGRVSFELVQKAAAARVPILAGISAPTSLAVRAGRALRITVVGFVRGPTMTIYSAAERILR